MGSCFQVFARSGWVGVFLLVFWAVVGCQHTDEAGINPSNPFRFPDQTNGPPVVASASTGGSSGPTNPVATASPQTAKLPEPSGAGRQLRVGEKITVIFSGLPKNTLEPHEQRIREDGTITLPLNVIVRAEGKTQGQLEDDVRKEYVPKYYKQLTVTVKTEDRFYYVGGEVKIAARQPYLGPITVLRAIQSAGDFTDYANRRKIELTRATGERHVINWYKAVKDPKLDLEVFPGDQILVNRRWF